MKRRVSGEAEAIFRTKTKKSAKAPSAKPGQNPNSMSQRPANKMINSLFSNYVDDKITP